MGWLSQSSCVTTFVVLDVLVSLAAVTNSLQILVAHTNSFSFSTCITWWWSCSSCHNSTPSVFSFQDSTKEQHLVGTLPFLWQREKQGIGWIKCDSSKRLLETSPVSPRLTFSLVQTSHMAKPDNREEYSTYRKTQQVTCKWAGMCNHHTGERANMENNTKIHHMGLTY